MKIVVDARLTDEQMDRIRAAAPDACVHVAATSEQKTCEMAEAEIAFGNFSANDLAKGQRLAWVQTRAAGVDGLLSPEFVESDVILTSAKGTVGVHLAEQAMALLLSLTRGIARAIRERPSWDNQMSIRADAWELLGKTMGIVGLGGTGRDVAKRAVAFGMRVIAVDPEDMDKPCEVESLWKLDHLTDLQQESDVVCICAPLTKETHEMFDRSAFEAMKSTAILINVTRGKIVNDEDLVQALREGKIAGAGLDTPPLEPLPPDHPLWDMPNVVITPHVAGGSPARDDRAVDLFCENLRRFQCGEPMLSVIDKRKGY